MNGRRPLHLAAASGDPEAVASLLGRAVSLDVRDDAGDTPLVLAVRGGHAEVVVQLLEAGADPQRAEVPLVLIASPELRAVLVEQGLDPAARDAHGDGLWMYARSPDAVAQAAAWLQPPGPIQRQRVLRAACHRPELLAALLVHLALDGVEPDARGLHGLTALHQAARWGHADSVGLLLAAGADPGWRTDRALVDRGAVFPAGMTARDLAPSHPMLQDAPRGAPLGHPLLLVAVGPDPEAVRFKLSLEGLDAELTPGTVLFEAPDRDSAEAVAHSLQAAGARVRLWHDATTIGSH